MRPEDAPDRLKRQNWLAGTLLIVIGASAVVRAAGYHIGTTSAMGPGFFPFALGAFLILLGIAIALSRPAVEASSPVPHADREAGIDMRGALCISGGIIVFVLLGHYAGLIPAAFGITFVSALGDRDNSLRVAALLAAGVTGVAVAVFWWALAINIPLFGGN